MLEISARTRECTVLARMRTNFFFPSRARGSIKIQLTLRYSRDVIVSTPRDTAETIEYVIST